MSTLFRLHRVGVLLLAGSCLLGTGCGNSAPVFPRAAASGTVTLDGKPLQEGIIRFVPTGKTTGPKTSININNGKFVADATSGPLVGQHRIEIISTDDGGYAPDDEEAFDRLRKNGIQRIEAVRVPPNYNRRSKLRESVSMAEPNQFRFDLAS